MKRTVLACLISLAYVVPGQGQSPEQKKETIAYLRKLQTRQGGFLPAVGAERGSLRATTAALRALKYFGGKERDRAGAAAYVKRCFDKDSGGFKDHPMAARPGVAVTAVGLLAVVELKIPPAEYVAPALAYLGKHARNFEEIRIAAAGVEAVGKQPPQADAWLKLLASMRNTDGTFGKGAGLARATGGAAVAELRLGRKLAHKDKLLDALKKGQRADGGYGTEGAKGSDLGTTYRVIRAFHMLKDVPDVKKVHAFVARCRNADGGYGVRPGDKSSVSGTYFAGSILHWLESR